MLSYAALAVFQEGEHADPWGRAAQRMGDIRGNHFTGLMMSL